MRPLATLLAALFLLLPLASGAHAQGFSMPRADVELTTDCDECPLMVTLPSGLRMSRGHISLEEFEAFTAETGYKRTTWGCAWNFPGQGMKLEPDDAAVCISYIDAETYLGWLSRKAGRMYRLPTVEEYRYAAQGGQPGNYWWGQDIGENRANCLGCKADIEREGPTAAGVFAANPYGLYDAVGNAWQWTSDCKDEACTERVLIGGSWSSPPADLRLTKTISNKPDLPFYTYGLRVVTDENSAD